MPQYEQHLLQWQLATSYLVYNLSFHSVHTVTCFCSFCRLRVGFSVDHSGWAVMSPKNVWTSWLNCFTARLSAMICHGGAEKGGFKFKFHFLLPYCHPWFVSLDFCRFCTGRSQQINCSQALAEVFACRSLLVAIICDSPLKTCDILDIMIIVVVVVIVM